MTVIFRCNEYQQQEVLKKIKAAEVEFVFIKENDSAFYSTKGDVYFDLLFEENKIEVLRDDVPVFVNSVLHTCNELPLNCIRINAWNGFLEREIIEIATNNNLHTVKEIMNKLGWKYLITPDEPGMITPRIIAMIVNEAYYALEDEVSTPEEIDIAMKLGTNYPYGPFEWSKKIGIKNIYLLLQKLCMYDKRYLPCKLLKEAVLNVVK